METTAKRTLMPTVAGILDIITGCLGIIGVLFLFAILFFVSCMGTFMIELAITGVAFMVLAIPSLILVILALIGGIFAVQRKRWGWALAGSIAAIFSMFPLGVVATVLTAISKEEFE